MSSTRALSSEDTGRSVSGTFKALRNPNYRLFWFGQIVSVTGTWMQNTAMAWLVLKMTNSPFALGSVSTVQFSPVLFFSLFGGVIADRFPKRRLLFATQTVMMVQAAAVGVLVATGLVRLWEIYALAALQGCANAIDNPTRQAFIVEMVGPEDLPNAIALNSSQFQLARLAGPALGGIAIAAVGTAGCFFLNAASFLAVIGGLALMNPKKFFPAAYSGGGNMLAKVHEGIRYAFSVPDITLALIMMAVLGTFGFNMTVLLPLIARYVLHAGPSGFGLITSALAVGSLLATLTIAYVSRASRVMLLAGAASFSSLLLAVSVSHWWALTIPLMIGLGFASSMYTATNNSRLQLVTPGHLRGRVMSINSLLFQGSTPIGALVIGFLAEKNGVQAATAELGIICLAGVVVALFYYRRVRYKLIPESQLYERATQQFAAQASAPADLPTGRSSVEKLSGGEPVPERPPNLENIKNSA
jgi:MFS family permease